MVLEGNFVDRAFIHFGPDNFKPLQRISEDSNLWKYSQEFHGGSLKYKYSVYSQAQDIKSSFFKLFNKDSTRCEEESDERHLKESPVQFDVFFFPKDKMYLSETLPKGILFYLKFMLANIIPSSTIAILAGVNNLRFFTFSPKHIKECVKWIVEQAPSGSVTRVQRFYLCIVLSHLNLLNPPPFQLLFPNDGKIAKACDCLLQCLDACIYYYEFLSTSNRERLKTVAVMLVKNSSRPGWLTLAAHFYSYFGTEFVQKTKHAVSVNYTYGNKEYMEMASSLLSKIVINVSDENTHLHLLELVLKSAPNRDAALELFESLAVDRLFINEDKKVEFFIKHLKSTTRGICRQTENVGMKLMEVYHLPVKLRAGMHKLLFSLLLEYATSDNESNSEHGKIFLQLVKSGHLDKDQVVRLLVELSKSKSVLCQNLLLEILSKEKEAVEHHWYKTDFFKKKEICQSWVITRVVDKSRASGLVGANKVAAAYEAIDAIMQCSLTNSNKYLAQQISSHVVRTTLRNEDILSFLKALASIEECTDVVQECYISQVKKKLKQDFNTVKKSSIFLKECPNSRYLP